MNKTFILSMSIVTCLTVSALAAETGAQSTDPVPAGQTAPSAGKSIEGGRAHKRSSRPVTGAGTEKPNAEPVSGTVLETFNYGGYSYVNLQKKSGDNVWLAVIETSVKTGSQVSFKPGLTMTNFESKGLKRTFNSIIFTEGLITSPNSETSKLVPSPGGKVPTTAKDEKISITKATGPNAITVAEAFSNSAKLDKKKIVVNGKVVKVSTGIMKRNWIHIQDGTGSQKKNTNNLVCTSKDLAAVGDVITVSGTLIKDRDFGSGYSYKTIIENATFRKEPL